MIIIAMHELLRISDADVQMIVYLALGGAGVIAIEKSVGALSGNGDKKPTKK
jgi:hypothetical protein